MDERTTATQNGETKSAAHDTRALFLRYFFYFFPYFGSGGVVVLCKLFELNPMDIVCVNEQRPSEMTKRAGES